jgi:hypothetical protein
MLKRPNKATPVLEYMRKHGLTLWQLVDEEGNRKIEKAWALMANLDLSYADIEKALVDLIPGQIR